MGVVQLPPLHGGGQLAVFNDPARFKVLVCGRRWGKSLLAATVLISIALRGGVGWWVWPSFPMSMVGWRRLLKILEPLITAKQVRVRKGERLIEFPGGGSIQMRSAERANSLRGEGLDFVVIDEWAYIKNGDEVWESDLRPALAEKMGGALLVTTPKGIDHVYTYYHKAQKDPQFSAYQFATWDNPFIPKEEIEAARKNISPEIFAQEYEGKFISGGATFFTDVERVMRAEYQHSALPGHWYGGGLDIGRYKDNTVLSIGDFFLDPAEICFVEEYHDMPFAIQKGKILTACARYGIDILTMDVTGMGYGLGERIAEEAPFTCEPETYTNPKKIAMFTDLQASYDNDELLIPDEDRYLVEHNMIIPEIVPGRLTVKLNAKAGFTDDVVNSFALLNKSRRIGRTEVW